MAVETQETRVRLGVESEVPAAWRHGGWSSGGPRSSSRWGREEFPSIAGSGRKQGNARTSLAPSKRDAKMDRRGEPLRFSTVDCEKVIFRDLPFEFCWPSNGGKRGQGRMEEKREEMSLNRGNWMDMVQMDQWFRAPPKVRMVPGIMGRDPYQNTRVTIQEGGEREVGGDPESGHRVPASPPHPPVSVTAQSEIQNHEDATLDQKIPNLRKIAGHLWKGSPTKSYASALPITAAKIVVVMNRGGDGGGGGRRGLQRDGGGGGGFGRYGQGDGRDGAKGRVWERTRKPPMEQLGKQAGQIKQEQQASGGEETADGGVHQIQHPKKDAPLKESEEGKMAATGGPMREQQRGGPIAGGDQRGNFGTQACPSCDICGLSNHLTKDCRRQYCEFCGLGNHNTYQCRRCVLWNVGPELCAIQAEEQSFLFVDEDVDPRVAREKESTATITIVKGEATARQVEMEFSNLMGSDSWKWKAEVAAENKFTMRFPNVKLLGQWCHFKFLPMECAEALMKVETWTPCVGAVGMLQQAWFIVHGIPTDQRSIRTIAKVGGSSGEDSGH